MSAKSSIVLPLVYLLIYALVSMAGGGVYLLARWAVAYNPAFPRNAGWLAAELPGALAAVLPASAIASVFLLFFRIMHRPGKRVLSFLLPLLTSAIVLYGSVSAVASLCGADGCDRPSPPNPLVPYTVHPALPDPFYAGTVTWTDDGTTVSPVVIAGRDIESVPDAIEVPPRTEGESLRELTWFALARIDEAAGSMTIAGDGSRDIRPANPVYGPLFAPPRFLAGIVGEIERLNSHLYTLKQSGSEQLAFMVFAISLFAMSSWWVLRCSRWPLLNMILVLALLRAVFLLLTALTSDLGRAVAGVLPDPQMAGSLPAVVFLAAGVVFTLIDFLFVPYFGHRGR